MNSTQPIFSTAKSCIMFILFLSLFITSCRKDRGLPLRPDIKAKLDEKLVYRIPQTAYEKQLVVNLEKITEVIKNVYNDKEALKVVNAAIQSKIYTDQSIAIKDLIYPNEGLLASSTKFRALAKKLNVQETKFSDAFWATVNKTNDTEFSRYLISLKPKNRANLLSLNKNGWGGANGQKSSAGSGSKSAIYDEIVPINDEPTIYFPYAEQYINPFDNTGNYTPETSIMTATADADEGYGWQPIDVGSGLISYVQVVINDDYAEINPTHVIGINGIHEVNPNYVNNMLTFPPGPPIVVPNLPRNVKQVFVGEARCRKQYDHLISFTGNGGGSEIRFTRSDGFLKVADGQVQADHFIVSGPNDISRYNIKKGNWVDWTAQWDGDWEADNLEQNLAVYEEDNRNSITATVSISTKLKIGIVEATGTIGGSFTFKSDDGLIHQQNYKHLIFFPLNRGYAGEPTRNGWLIYDNNSQVSFTLPDRTLTQ